MDIKKKCVLIFIIRKRKNITNGEIVLNQIDPADKIEEETEVTEYDDSLLKAL